MRYTTYLFDFDYTLADSSRGIVICFRNVLERHEHTGISDEAIKRTIGKTLEDSFSILSGITDPATLAAYRKEYEKEADTHMTINTEFFPETITVLQELKSQGVKIGIISTKYRYRIREMVDLHFPKGFFDIIIGGEDVKKAKPNPQGIKKALRQLHRRKEETLYIGDSTIDAEAAQLAKVDFAGVLNGMTTREELAAYPHRQILDNLSLLPLVLKFSPYEPSKHFPEKIFYSPYFPQKAVAFYRLLHQKQIRGRYEAKESPAHCTCKNCGKSFHGNHCPHCGQRRNTPRFTLRNAFQNIMSGFFNIDNGFSRNLTELLYRPGYMIRDYLRGKRVHYYKPFQTLFVLAALYIMAVRLIDPEAMSQLESENVQNLDYKELISQLKHKQNHAVRDSSKYYLKQSIAFTDSARIIESKVTSDERLEHTIEELEKEQEQVKERDAIDEVTDAMALAATAAGGKWKEQQERFFTENSFFIAVTNLMKSWIHGNKAFSILALLPLFTLGTRWSFRRTSIGRRLNLTENFFAQVYIACQILLISLLILPFTRQAHLNDIFDLSYKAIFVLFVWDYRQLFGLSWWKSFCRTAIMFWYCFLGLLLISTLVIVIIVAAAYIVQWTK